MTKSTKVIIIVILLLLAVIGIVYISKSKTTIDTAGTDDDVWQDHIDDSIEQTYVDMSTKQYTASEQAFHDKVAATNSLEKSNVIKEARKSMLTGGLSGVVNSSNNITSALNKLFKKKK